MLLLPTLPLSLPRPRPQVTVAKRMEERGMKLPLLIGGATTSKMHTAVKIAPQYSGPVVYVLDASRSVPVAQSLLDHKQKEAFVEDVRQVSTVGLRAWKIRGPRHGNTPCSCLWSCAAGVSAVGLRGVPQLASRVLATHQGLPTPDGLCVRVTVPPGCAGSSMRRCGTSSTRGWRTASTCRWQMRRRRGCRCAGGCREQKRGRQRGAAQAASRRKGAIDGRRRMPAWQFGPECCSACAALQTCPAPSCLRPAGGLG